MRYFFILILLVCMVQAQKGIDLSGYLWHVSHSIKNGFATLPYPIEKAQNGDFFQSPVTTLILVPFTFLPLAVSKAVFALLNALGLLLFLKSLKVETFSTKNQLVLILFFTHALSDVFLSLNLLFSVCLLLWFSHGFSLSSQRRKRATSGFFFSIALFLRPFPALIFPVFLFSKKRRGALPWIAFFSGLGVGLSFFIFPNPLEWWNGWFSSLALYQDAAYVLAPTFQTPLSNFDRIAYYLFRVPVQNLNILEAIFGFFYLTLSYVFFIKLERRGETDLAFAILLSALYCSFSRLWASGFFYCLPLIALTLEKSRTRFFFILAVGYSLLPKWAWPTETWAYLIGVLGFQGWLIFLSIIYSWVLVFNLKD